MNDLNELLERVRSATGPDRSLDEDIASELENGWKWNESARCFVTPEGFMDTAPKYTASTDAALALVDRLLPGWVVADLCQNSRHAGDPWGCSLAVYYGSTPSKNRSAQSGYDFPTAPLAILAALLSALISKESQS